LNIECKENFEIKNLTTFKVGGQVNKVYFPTSQHELISILRNEPDAVVLGACSNVLFSSQGYDGTVICTSKMKYLEVRGTKVIAECGVKGPLLSKRAFESRLSGFEFMIGFPGSVGGILSMNAGAHSQSISESVSTICLFDKETQEIVYFTNKQMDFGYRHSILQSGKYVALGAEFSLKKEDPEKIKALMDRNLEFRKNIQPSLSIPNAGSVFRNPENDSAGRLLDKAGVKEFDFINVAVWDKHANFIINKGEATSQEILELMFVMYNRVKQTYTIELVPEIRYIGKMNRREEEICRELYKTRI